MANKTRRPLMASIISRFRPAPHTLSNRILFEKFFVSQFDVWLMLADAVEGNAKAIEQVPQ